MNGSPRAARARMALRLALMLLPPVGSLVGCAPGVVVGFGADPPIGVPVVCSPRPGSEPPILSAMGFESETPMRTGRESGKWTQRGVVGEPPPDLTLPDLDGNLVPLRSFKGRIAVFDFWAVWCGPCRMSLPFFQDLENRYREHGLVVIGLHVDDRMPGPEAVRAFVEEWGADYLNLLSTVESDEAFRVFAMPTTYIADRDGVVRARHIGFDPSRSPERIESEVRKLLGLE